MACGLLLTAGSRAEDASLRELHAAPEFARTCESVVMRCNQGRGAASVRDDPDDEKRQARTEMESARAAIIHPDPLDPDELPTIEVSADGSRGSRAAQMERLRSEVERAHVPECLEVSPSMGLFAIPIVPLMKLSGHCR